jgi:PadR family transcriptional regulator, regulatory protein PadR
LSPDSTIMLTTRARRIVVVLLTDATNLSGWTLAKYSRVNSGTLYVWLDRLERAGLIAGVWEEPAADDDDRPRRRFYRLTPDGWVWAWATLGLQPPDSRRL